MLKWNEGYTDKEIERVNRLNPAQVNKLLLMEIRRMNKLLAKSMDTTTEEQFGTIKEIEKKKDADASKKAAEAEAEALQRKLEESTKDNKE